MAKRDKFVEPAFEKPTQVVKKHYVVTGGAGFIGSNLVLRLQSLGHEVSVIDDFTSANFKNLKGFTGEFIPLSCETFQWDNYFLNDVDGIFHLASIVDTTLTNQREMCHRNITGFTNLLDSEMVTEGEVPVVWASSAAVYGIRDGINKESDSPAPANVYGFSKLMIENSAALKHREFPETTLIGLRFFNVYGPREMHKGNMASMVYQLYCQMHKGQNPRVYKNGEQQRDFVYVKDVVEGLIAAMNCKKTGVYNLGSGLASSFNALIAELNTSMNTNLDPEYIDNPYIDFYQVFTEADLTLSKKTFGFVPKFNLNSGVRDYVKWLKENNL